MSQERFRDLGKGRRKSARRTFHYSAKVLGPDAIQWDGFIVDISESGAQLEFIDTRDIPDRFSLLIGGHRQVKRACEVVWRSPDRLGVRFLPGGGLR
jgi:PilZ domain